MNKKSQIKNSRWKILTLLSFVFFLSVNVSYASEKYNANELAQVIKEKKVTLNFTSKPINEILTAIQKQTEIDFGYTERVVLSQIPKISINVKNVPVEQALTTLLKDTGYEYKIVADRIIIDKGEPNVQKPKKADEKIVVKGKVLDGAKNPVSGATIIVTGTTNGAISGPSGEFNLTMASGQDIEVTYVGFVDHKQKIATNMDNLIITLTESSMVVEDVVVTGIFERRSGSFTGSATTLKAEDLKRVGNTNIFASLRNLDPSLMIFDNFEAGSDPNKNPEMTLRGTSSVDIDTESLDIKGTYGNDPNAPLFILDGFETTVQRIMDLDMDRLESLTILKDASAKAIYGSKAANGVIVIETKKKSASDLRITYNATLDIQAPDLTSYNLTNAAEKLELERIAGVYTSRNGLSEQLRMNELYNDRFTAVVAGIDTDWMSKPLRTGVGTKHSINLDLGMRPLSVIANFSYNNVAGVMKKSNRETYNGSINVSYRNKKFTFRNILNVSSNIANDSPYGSFSEYSRINPYYTPYDQNGILLKNCVFSVAGTDQKNTEFIENPLYNASLNTKIQQKYIDITNNLYVEWIIKTGLKVTGRFGVTENRNSADEFYPSNHLKFMDLNGDDYFRKGSYQQNVGWNKKLSGDLNAQYNVSFKDTHHLFANVGFQLGEDSYEEVVHKAEGFPNDRMNDIIFAKQYLKDGKPNGSEQTKRDIGVLGAINYSYKDRYLFDGSYRVSASSQFGKNNRWGQFWSVGAGWNIHKEEFFGESEALTLFKVRASVGYTGAQNSAAYESMATYKYLLDRTYRGQIGAYLRGMRNDDLKWQQKMDYNIGLDFNLYKKLILVFDFYVANTKNNLIDMSIPPSLGFRTYKENVGTIQNKGFDMKVTYNAWQRPKDNSYLSFTASFFANKNKISDLSDAMRAYNEQQDALAADIYNNKPVKKYLDGGSLDAIWAVRSLGIDPTNGREIYMGRDGIPTYTYNVSDQEIVGNSVPKFSGVAGVNFQYKGFGFNATFRFNYGAKLYNSTLVNKVENADIRYNVDKRMYDGVWRKPGDVKPYKALGERWIAEESIWKKTQTQATSRFVQNRNELSLSNLSLSYEFRTWDFVKKAKMENIRLSFYMNDVFMLSSIEVERGTGYPFARGFNFGLTAIF